MPLEPIAEMDENQSMMDINFDAAEMAKLPQKGKTGKGNAVGVG